MTVDDRQLKRWFCDEVLPLEPSLTRFLNRHWRDRGEIADLRQDIYEAALNGASKGLPAHAAAYVFTIARNIIINRAKRARIVSFDQVADVEALGLPADLLHTERHLDARDALRRTAEGMAALPPRCREVVRLRKVEGLSTREAAVRMGVGIDTIERQLVLGLRALTDRLLGGDGRIRRTPARAARNGEGR
jgi:RNA polymerase sigma-70 factor (ECF subfamily)